MKNSTARLALLSSVSTAMAMFVLPASAQAQTTTCSQAGTTITCVDGTATVLTATTTPTTTTVPGPGLVTVNTTGPSTTTYVATGSIATTAVTAINLTSTGGALSFIPSGSGAPVNVRTVGGVGANGVTLNTLGQAATVTVGNIATSGINSIGVLSTGGTSLTLRTGNISTTGANSSGIAISGGTTAAVNCGNVSTTGANSPAVVVAANGTTSITCGTVTTTGAASDAILVTNTAGTTTITSGTTSATGAGSRGIVVSSSAPSASDLVTVNTGVVTANGNGVVASSTGGANVIVSASGNVTSSTGAAITVTTAGGAATVNQSLGTTITAATDAIRINNTVGGAINVNALGTLLANNGSGVFVSTNAASAAPINVTTNIVRSTGGPGTWGSQVRASAGTGDITITSNGPISSAGAPGSIFGGILAVTSGTSIRNVTVNVNADIGSPTDRSSAAQVLVSGTSSSAKTLAVNIANANIFGGPGAVQVQQNATSLGDVRIIGTGVGTLSANGPTGIGINARILNAANPGNILVDVTQNVDGTVQGINATTLGSGNVTVAARGNVTSVTGTGITAATGGATLVTIGAGTTTTGVQGASLQGVAGNTLIVNGTLRNTGGTTPYTVLAGGPFTLTLGPAGMIVGPLAFTSGNDTFNNQGAFALPAALDFLAGTDVLNNTGTLTAFTGTSSISNLETFNNTGGLIDMRDGAANDVVNLANSNYVATGNARLGIDVIGTGGTLATDRLVIGGTTSGTTTLLANFVTPIIDPTGARIVDSSLNNVAPGQFVLGGTTNFGLINFAVQTRGGDVFLVSTPDARAYDTVFAGRQVRDLWYRSADVYTAYATARRVSFGQERKAPIGFWAQLYGETGKAGDRNRTTSLFGTSLAVSDRIRTDYRGAQGGIDFGSSNFVVGLTGGYARAKADTNAATDLVTEGRNYGAYAQFGMTSGIYAGALIKRDDYRTRFNNDAIQAGSVRSRSRSEGIEGEVGLRTGGEGNINFDVGAGLAYVRSKLDTFNFGNITFDANRATSMRGRVHARASFAGDIAPFIEARGFHEFRGDTDFRLRSGSASTTLDGSGKGTWVRIEGGIGGGTGGGALLSAWADLGDTRGYGLRAGFRF